MGDLWSEFPLDPRQRAHAGLRASDQDRERITAELASAFADGRLTRDELDERTDAVASARTLGDLPPLVADLVPLRTPPTRPAWPSLPGGSARSLVPLSPQELHERAEQEWRERRRAAVFSFLSTTVVLTGVAVFLDLPWLMIFSALTFLNVVRVVTAREQFVRERVRSLERKQARQRRWPKGLPGA